MINFDSLLAKGIRFDSDAQVFWIPSPNQGIESYMDGIFNRTPGTLQWKVPNKSYLGKVVSFASAVVSGFATPEQMAKRQRSCFGDIETPACSALITDASGKYCGACGCGKWLMSNLAGSLVPKFLLAGTMCPLKRPGFANGT